MTALSRYGIWAK